MQTVILCFKIGWKMLDFSCLEQHIMYHNVLFRNTRIQKHAEVGAFMTQVSVLFCLYDKSHHDDA